MIRRTVSPPNHPNTFRLAPKRAQRGIFYGILGVLGSVILVGCLRFEPTPPDLTATPSVTAQPTVVAPSPAPTFENPSQRPLPQIVEKTTLEIWHSLDGDSYLALHAALADFRRQNPKIHLNLRYIPYDDMPAQLQSAASLQNSPEIVLGPTKWGPILLAQDRLLDLRTAFSAAELAALNPAALDGLAHQHVLMGLPYAIQGVVLYRNTAILKNSAASFDQLVENAQNVTQGEIVGAYLERGDIFGLGQMLACNTNLMYTTGLPAFNTPEGLCWLELLIRFNEAGPASFNTNRDLAGFKAGKVGYLIEGTWRLPELTAALQGHLVIDLWPAYHDRQLSGYVWSENIFLVNHLTDDQLSAALLLARDLISPDAQMIFASWMQIPAIQLETDNLLFDQAMRAMVSGAPYPHQAVMPAYLLHFNRTLPDVFDDQQKPEDALQNVSITLENIVRRAIDEQHEVEQ